MINFDGSDIMHNKYTYDAVDNILGIANTVNPQELSNNSAKLSGESSHTYQYDALNRLISASGSAKDASYTLSMAYNVMSMPVSKAQTVENSKKANSYNLEYKYEDAEHPSAPSQIGHEHYTYDANGNPVRVENDSTDATREMFWDEDNRLMVLSDNGKTSRYTYNHAGERIVKSHGSMEGVYINGAPQGITFHETDEYTLYPASILSVTKNRFTKNKTFFNSTIWFNYFLEREMMKQLLIILLSAFTCCACSKSTIYQVKCDDRLIEKRNYQNGKLQSIVAYNCTDTKDSIIFKDEVVWFHYGDNGFSLEKDVPFQKFYYPCFDKSLGDRAIYRMVKSQILLEDVLWSLAAIDDELNSGHMLLSDNKRIVAMNDVCNIEYTNIDSNIMLYGLFELYNTEILHSLKILIKEGLLYKLIFTGKKTRQVVDFEYENSILAKEKIYFYDIRTGKCSFTQDYSFESARQVINSSNQRDWFGITGTGKITGTDF